MQHIWLIKCRIECQVDLVPTRLEIAILTNGQSGIESCRGLFIGLNRPLLRRSPMPSSNKLQMRFGANLAPTRCRATYPALRRIGISYRPVRGGLSSTPLSVRRPIPGHPSTRDGILERLAFYSEPTPREQFLLQSRYQGSLMGSHDSLTGRSL